MTARRQRNDCHSMSRAHRVIGSLATLLLFLSISGVSSEITLGSLGPTRITPVIPSDGASSLSTGTLPSRQRLGRILSEESDRNYIKQAVQEIDDVSPDALAVHDLSKDGKKHGHTSPIDITPAKAAHKPSGKKKSKKKKSGNSVKKGGNHNNIRLSPLSWGTPTSTPVTYHGGPVMTKPMTLYLIFYGDWATNDTQKFFDFIGSISSNYTESKIVPSVKHWWSLVRKYKQADGKSVTNDVKLGKAVLDKTYTSGPGKVLTNYQQDIVSIVNFYLINRVFPSDSNAVYMVLTDPSVTVASPNANDGFCTHFCGYHSYGASLNGQILKFGFVGHASRCPSKCIRNLPFKTVNGNALDSTVSTFAHELSEVANDPMFTAWYDEQGSEAADKCSFLYGFGWLTKEKRAYNVMGQHKTTFLVQAMLDWKKNTCVQ